MITTLHIKNIGIIDDLSIDLNNGLNVLTGETGAGKTLIIDSLSILSGGRFSKEMIRKGENHSYVERFLQFQSILRLKIQCWFLPFAYLYSAVVSNCRSSFLCG